MIKDMNHALGNKQPWLSKRIPKHLKVLVNETIKFIETN